jgi:hypothetical protein
MGGLGAFIKRAVGQVWWLKPIILTTQGVEIRRIMHDSSLAQSKS